jgi:hypothetical protein
MLLIVLISAHEEFTLNKKYAYAERKAYFILTYFSFYFLTQFDAYSTKGTALDGYNIHAFFQS